MCHLRLFFGLVLGIFSAGSGFAAVTLPACTVPACYDLTTAGSSALINGAIFRVPTTEVKATGTGNIDAFVRLQRTGSEQGYNTSDRAVQFDENTDLTFTHDLLLSSIPSVTIGGTEYLEFVLDTNENNSPAGRYLSLEELRFFSGTNQATNTAAGDYDTGTNTLGLLSSVWDMDAGTDTYLQLDYSLWSGQGQLDLILLVPKNLFVVPGLEENQTYVYLYSQFGQAAPLDTDAGFEEWAHRVGSTFTTPEPGSIVLMLVGLFALGCVIRRGGHSPSTSLSLA